VDGTAEEMKGRKGATKAFRVPLLDEALRIIDIARPHARNGYLFPNVADGGVVRAYRRTDFLEQRTKLAERWANHLTGGAGRVVRLAGTP
jgi:hypothetical protein